MNRRPLSIRTLLLLTVGILTLLVTLLVAREVYQQWKRLEKIVSLKEATSLSDQLFKSLEALSVERDIAFAMLYAPTADDIKKLAPRLREIRPEVDKTFQTTLLELAPYQFAEMIELRRQIDTQLTDIRALRSIVDREITLPKPKRDKILASRWYDDVSALNLHTQKLWAEFLKHFTDIDSRATQHMRVKHLLRIIVNNTAAERAIISRLLVESTAPTPENIAQLLKRQGASQHAWEMSALLSSQSGLFPTITPVYDDAQSHYQAVADMVRNIFYVPGSQHGAAYPISVDLWLELSAQANESLDALEETVFKESSRYVETLEMQARDTIFAHTVFLLAVLSLCVYGLWIIIRRVIRPINMMVEALMSAMQGKQISFERAVEHRQDEIGKLVQVLHAFQENAAQVRKATFQIEQREKKLRAVVDYALDGLITINEKGIIESFNPACERIFGYKAEEVIGQNIKMLMPEPYHSEHDGYISHYVHTGDAKIIGTAGREVSAKRKDNTVFPIDLSISAFVLEDGRHFSGIIRDITTRKEAEQRIRDSQERYRALVESSAQIVWTWKEGSIEKNSPLRDWWEATTGQPADAIATFGWLEIVHPEDRDRVRKIWENAMAAGRSFDMEYRLRAKSGGYVHVAVKGVALLAADGSVREFIGSLNDVTARKDAEAHRKRYMKELERSNQELDDFAYIASHDLKEPLRGLFNHASFLQEDYKDKLDADGIRRLNRLSYLSQRMEHLVNDLLYFSRLGRTELAVQETDLNAIIADIGQMIDPFLKERNARIVVLEPLPKIVCDRPRITEVFRNLITNAAKYNDKPERLVEVGFIASMQADHGEEKDVFYVKDNGIGIEREFYQEVFRIFKRLQKQSDEKESGTGVGLTFVKKIIERHRGRIWLESESGKGTTFYFTIGRKDL
jgi:two-component system sensor kinase FixL